MFEGLGRQIAERGAELDLGDLVEAVRHDPADRVDTPRQRHRHAGVGRLGIGGDARDDGTARRVVHLVGGHDRGEDVTGDGGAQAADLSAPDPGRAH